MTIRTTGRQASLLARAVALLARREMSRGELARKLARRRSKVAESEAPDPAEIEQLLDQLEAEGLLSDRRFAVSRVRIRSERYGNARLLHELRESGVDREIAADAVATAAPDELTRAHALWKRRFGAPASSLEERARQMRFLQARGFSSETIRTVIRLAERR